MQNQQPQGPFTVDNRPDRKHETMAEARIFAGQMQANGQRRSLQIFDRHGNVCGLKRY